MRFKSYALALVMASGLGTAAFAQSSEWGVPGGSIHPTESRYVTSATTTGAERNLSYSNSVKPSGVFIDTGASFTVAPEQTFTLHVTTSNEMMWCHGVIYVDWNGDKDFDDEGEMIAKIGFDDTDDGLPQNFGGIGGVGNKDYILDFTQEMTVPEDAFMGETRLRLQFQDAWHSPDGEAGKGHAHTAMDDIDKGGVYDFVMDIQNPEVATHVMTVTIEGPGTLTVTGSEGTEIRNGDRVVEGEELTITATPDAGANLTSLTVGGEDFTSGETYTVTGETTIAATFVNPWGAPEGTFASGETNKVRYVTEATTTGAEVDLAYENSTDYYEKQAYIYTGAGMTVAQGQEITLNVKSTENMKWCHAIVWIDWNGDRTFDNDTEMLPKVGYDSKDAENAGYNISDEGNPDVCDFTHQITVPEDATVGQTRMRVQFTNAWHKTGVPTPSHSAMDDVMEGGVYDFDVTVVEGAAEPEGEWKEIYNIPLGWNTQAGAELQSDLSVSDGLGLADDYEVVPGYDYFYYLTGCSTDDYFYLTEEVPADGKYKFTFEVYYEFSSDADPQALSFNFLGDGEPYSTIGQSEQLVDGLQTIESPVLDLTAGDHVFGVSPALDMYGWDCAYIGGFRLYQFVEVGPDPGPGEGEWVAVYSNRLSGATAEDVDITDFTGAVGIGVQMADDADGAVFEGEPYSLAYEYPWQYEYVYLTYEVKEAGKYKFSMRSRYDGTGTVSAYLCYGSSEDLDHGNFPAVSSTYTITATTDLPGQLMESSEFDLEPGTYKFCLFFDENTSGTGNGQYLFIGDFNLYKYEEGAEPTDALLTIDAENCTVTVKNWEGTEVVTYEDGDRIPLNTRLLIQATANEGYTDATFTVNGQKWNSYAAWDVEEDVHIVATAAKEEVCVVNYTFEGEEYGSMQVYESGLTIKDIANGGTVAVGSAVNVSVAMNEETVKGTIVINDGEPEEFDYASWDGTYSKRIKIEEGMETLNIAVKLEQGEAPKTYKVDFSITNPELADEYSFAYDNDNELVVGSNDVAEGAQLGLMVLFERNEDVKGVVKVDGEVVDRFDYESCSGTYIGTVVESVDRDLKVEVELTDGSGLGSKTVDGVAVYPTVFTDNVTVAVPADGRVTVYDLSGAAVYTAEVVAGSNVLGLGNLGDGLYVVKVESDGASTTVQVLKK